MNSLEKLYHAWNEQLSNLLSWKRSEHHRVLAWMMVAIFVGKEICLDRLGLHLPREAKPESIAQQFRRWLKHEALDSRVIYDAVARQIVGKMRCRRLRVQIDRVQIKRRQNVLMMSVYYRKRAIPLMWICLTHSGNSNYTHWKTLLDYLETLLSPQMQVVILADREFGSADRLRYVVKKGWYYAIRLKGNVEFYKPDWEQPIIWLSLLDIAPQIGASYSLTQIIMTKGELYSTALACAWARGSDEP